jgi:hypothetical protein
MASIGALDARQTIPNGSTARDAPLGPWGGAGHASSTHGPALPSFSPRGSNAGVLPRQTKGVTLLPVCQRLAHITHVANAGAPDRHHHRIGFILRVPPPAIDSSSRCYLSPSRRATRLSTIRFGNVLNIRFRAGFGVTV